MGRWMRSAGEDVGGGDGSLKGRRGEGIRREIVYVERAEMGRRKREEKEKKKWRNARGGETF